MSKYKEALHFFESYIGVTDDNVTNNLVEEYVDIMNELIDKEALINEEYIEFLENMFILFSKTYVETWEELMRDDSDMWLHIPKIQGSTLDIMIRRIAGETELKNSVTLETMNKAKEYLLKKYDKE